MINFIFRLLVLIVSVECFAKAVTIGPDVGWLLFVVGQFPLIFFAFVGLNFMFSPRAKEIDAALRFYAESRVAAQEQSPDAKEPE